MKVMCPSCQRAYDVHDACIGQQIACSCGETFELASAKMPAVQSESGEVQEEKEPAKRPPRTGFVPPWEAAVLNSLRYSMLLLMVVAIVVFMIPAERPSWESGALFWTVMGSCASFVSLSILRRGLLYLAEIAYSMRVKHKEEETE